MEKEKEELKVNSWEMDMALTALGDTRTAEIPKCRVIPEVECNKCEECKRDYHYE